MVCSPGGALPANPVIQKEMRALGETCFIYLEYIYTVYFTKTEINLDLFIVHYFILLKVLIKPSKNLKTIFPLF